jgi:hypothetical protein
MFKPYWDPPGVAGMRFEGVLGAPGEIGLPFLSNIWNKKHIACILIQVDTTSFGIQTISHFPNHAFEYGIHVKTKSFQSSIKYVHNLSQINIYNSFYNKGRAFLCWDIIHTVLFLIWCDTLTCEHITYHSGFFTFQACHKTF